MSGACPQLQRSTLPASTRMGTVDKVQGQEAPIAIYSMATSTADEAPHEMEFLYSLHRLNVATSRARGVAAIIANPRSPCAGLPHPEQMRLASSFLAPRTRRATTSRSRVAACASRRFATLTDAMSSTRPAAAARTNRAGRTGAVNSPSPPISSNRGETSAARAGTSRRVVESIPGFGAGVADPQPGKEHVDLCGGGLPRDAVLHAREYRDTTASPRFRGRHDERNPEPCLRIRKGEPRGHDADDRPVEIVQRHDSADDVRVSAEPSLPEAVAQNHHRVGAAQPVAALKGASERRPQSSIANVSGGT